MQGKNHYAAGVLAFVIWGFFSLPLKALEQYAAGEILYFRILFTLVFAVTVVVVFRRKSLHDTISSYRSRTSRQKRLALSLTLLGGLLLSLNWLTFIYVVNSINIRTASFSYLICPVITAVLGNLLLQERLSHQQWGAVALCTLSCILIGIGSSLELGYALLTATTYALYLITQRKNQGFDRIIILTIQVLFSFLILSVFFFQLVSGVPQSENFYFIIALIAILFTLIPLFLNLYALNKIDAATIGILMYINPLLNFGLAFLVFHESVTVTQVTGYLCLAGGLVLFNLSRMKRLQPFARAQKTN